MKPPPVLLAFLSTVSALAATPGWLTSYDKAQEFAAKSGRPILLNFTGSDWCSWCMRMKSETLSKPEFIRFASSNLILVELDFPQTVPQPAAVKTANDATRKKFNVSGFPTFLLVNPKGEVLGRQVGYLKGGVGAFTNELQGWIAKSKTADAAQ